MLFKDITSKLPQVYNVATRNKKTRKKIVRQFSFLFSGNARILFRTTAMERFFYSIIASCLIEFLASRSLTLSISKQDDSVHSISLLTGGHRSGRIPSAAGGEEVQR